MCLESELQPAMKMCPFCKIPFHSHCIAGWMLEFGHSTCPHCRARLTYLELEEITVVLPSKTSRDFSTQTISQFFPEMRSVECQSATPPLQTRNQYPAMISLNRSEITQVAGNSGEHSSPVSLSWSPISPIVTISPVITVSFPGSPATNPSASPAVSAPLAFNASNPSLPRILPESPVPQTLRSDSFSQSPTLTERDETLDSIRAP